MNPTINNCRKTIKFRFNPISEPLQRPVRFHFLTEKNSDFEFYIEIETVYEMMVIRETERHVQLGLCHTTGSPFRTH